MSPRDLNDRYLRSLKPPEVGRLEISDTRRPGLRLRITSARKATWMFEKRVKGGVKRKHTFGTYCTWTADGKREDGPIGLADARALALEIEAEAARGIDRVAIAREEKLRAEAAKSATLSLQSVLDTYEALHLSNLRRGKERKHQIATALKSKLASPIGELTKSDLQAAIDEKMQAGRIVFANRIRAALMAFSRWAWERGHLEQDIGASLPKGAKETERERVPSLEELRAIWRATFDMGEIWGPFLRVLILTAQRRSEILELEWSEVDFQRAQITKPGSKTKNGKEHVTHLSAPALEELSGLHGSLLEKGRRPSGFVFTTTGRTPVSGVSKAKKRLDMLLGAEVEPWRLHDLRTSFSTAMAESGVPESVADRVLNHAASGSAPSAVARVYNKAEMLPQRAAALDRWAEMVIGEQLKVISIKRSTDNG